MMAYVVLRDGHVHGVYTSPVDAHLQAKPLNATVEVCRLNSEVTAPPWTTKSVDEFCAHEWEIESMYGTKSERICNKCNCYQSDLPSPDCVINSDGSGSGPCA